MYNASIGTVWLMLLFDRMPGYQLTRSLISCKYN
jgi:hypothetical protein